MTGNRNRRNTLKVPQKVLGSLGDQSWTARRRYGALRKYVWRVYREDLRSNRKANWSGNMSKLHQQCRWPPPSFERIFLATHSRDHQNKLKLFVWACAPELKTLAQKKLKSCTNFAKCRLRGLSFITGKALHVLLSIVSRYFILTAFLVLGYFCQSVHPFDAAICCINQSRVLVNTRTIFQWLIRNVSILQLY